jgi:PAS domain S-box-containing protein
MKKNGNGTKASFRFPVKRYTSALLTGWTVIVVVSLLWNLKEEKKVVLESVRIQARALLDKDILYRRWNASHGGVYALVTEKNPPNPYLDKLVSERDIKTSSGRELTLISPADMTREVYELGKSQDGVWGHITSLNPVSLENAPDKWELKALMAFEKGESEASSRVIIGGEEFFRFMIPLLAEKRCLKCHEEQGYKEGDIQGGISASVPMASFLAASDRHRDFLYVEHLLSWLAGAIFIILGSIRISRSDMRRHKAEEDMMKAAEEWRTTFDSITDFVSVHDTGFRIVRANRALADFLKTEPEKLIGKRCYEVMHGPESPFPGCPHKEMLKTGRAETKEIFNTRYGLHLMITVSPIFENGELTGSVHYIKDITDKKRLGNMIREIALNISVKTGKEYFDAATKFIADELGVEYAFIGELDGDGRKVHTNSLYVKGMTADNIEYDLLTTPCDNVAGKTTCTYLRGVQELFPEDKMLVEMGAESYVGMPLFASDGSPLGIIVVLGCSSMEEEMVDKAISLLKIFSSRAASEIERKRSEKALSESEEKFRNIAEVSLVGVYLIQDGIFRYCNKRLADIFGYTVEELIDKRGPEDLVRPDDWHIVRENLRRRIEGEAGSIYYSFRGITKKRETIYVDVYGAKTDYLGRPAVIGTLLDITERKKAERERESLLKELEEKNRELEQMVYISSHDLRTPLVNISGYSGELRRAIDTLVSRIMSGEASSRLDDNISKILKEIPESLEFISLSAVRMDSLLNGLLQFSRLGKAELKEEELDMNSLISEILKSFEFQIRDIGVRLEISELPGCTGDSEKINQVFSNLIGNALKYMDPEKRGVIKISGYMEDGSSVYCVEDNGIGIAPAFQDRIFDIFHQLEPDMTGEGLGLTIVRRIVNMHEGRVWVESEEKRGSKFFVQFPCMNAAGMEVKKRADWL